MPTHIRVIHAHEFLRVNPEGKLDIEASTALLAEIAAASAQMVDYDIVLDTRKAQSAMPVADLWHLAAALSEAFRKASRRPLKTAVLCPVERFDQAGFFALCAQNRGFPVQAYTSFAEAYEWLIEDKS